MRKILSFFGDGVGSLCSRVFCSFPGTGEVAELVKGSRASIKESVASLRDKSKSLLCTNMDLGLYHFYRGNVQDAKTRFWFISLVRPKFPDVHYNIGRCHLVLRNIEKAVKSFERALLLDKSHQESMYYLQKIEAPEKVTEVPENIIRQHFNYTSEYFVEHWLIAQNYRGHEYVRSLVMNFLGDRISELDVLDLGCGTGVCGQFLKMKGIGRHITGVDISRRMLDIARKCFVNGRQAYNELLCMSMSEFLRGNNKKYDVIVMTEVLHYSGGHLGEILKATSGALAKGGMIIALVREGSGQGYRFVKEGDFFCHSGAYVQQQVESLGLRLSYVNRCKIYGDRVDGLLFAISHDSLVATPEGKTTKRKE
ncbi:methyltransferase [Anaplasma capra]|uniref:methyltransferase n=1 Tax=Anaplasma capra TaxID=1562740 RepID=UPI0021D5E39A|nr:methyltransferase [Anaplasma capra]MCU7611205.1 methyltransferase [Anaplasma capra]MCU7612291.1 methyltransferase [Anaplasma capra]